MRRKKRGSPEINLTPLLDVLFCLLFILILTYTENMETSSGDHIKKEAEYEASIEEYQQTIEDLENTVNEYENAADSFQEYRERVTIVTISNYVKNDEHYLHVSQGNNDSSTDIKLIYESLDNAYNRINKYVSDILDANPGNPVYVDFHVNKSLIYKAEYDMIEKVFQDIEKNKEVFCKITEK